MKQPKVSIFYKHPCGCYVVEDNPSPEKEEVILKQASILKVEAKKEMRR